MMQPAIRAADWSDWQCFNTWAKDEGWTVLPQEQELFLGQRLGKASVLLIDDRPAGFITTWQHGSSGWIGNLLIAREHRRHGHGTVLFERALQRLQQDGARTVWLTASQMGRALYERYGFTRVNGVCRWSRCGTGRFARGTGVPDQHKLIAADARAWGDDRSPLLLRLARLGSIHRQGWSLALLQDAGRFKVAGPWLTISADPDENRTLIAALLTQTPISSQLIVDVLAHSPVNRLLQEQGFKQTGSNELMALGPVDRVQFDKIVALATLGSIG